MTSLLIGAEALKNQIEQQSVQLLDLRPAADYAAGHIAGAIPFDLAGFNVRRGNIVGLLPPAEQFNRLVAGAGIDANRLTVACDESGGPAAARFVWTLKTFGHPQAAMLDGGYQHWRQQGYPISTTPAQAGRGTFTGRIQHDRVADRDYILAQLNNREVCIVDARTAAEFSGDDIRSARGGHIPGAVHLDWQETKDPQQPTRFKSADALQLLFNARGIRRDQEIICYCQSHQRSAVLCLLLEQLGYTRVKGYPGAWSDWGNQPDTPIEP